MLKSNRAAWAVAILAVGSLLAAACGNGGGEGEPLFDRLVIVRDEGIVELSLGSGEERLLIEKLEETFVLEPSVSPDGDELAYVLQLTPFASPDEELDFGMDLYLAAPDGSNRRLFQEHEVPNEEIRSPFWMPNGQSLLVVVQRIEDRQVKQSIQRVDLASGERTMVVEEGAGPAVSPDGGRIVYKTRDGNLEETLWLANIDGNEAIVLAGPDDDLVLFNSPRFSPDGSVVVFGASERGATVARDGEPRYVSSLARSGAGASRAESALNGVMDIWIVDVPAGSPRLLSDLNIDQPSLAWSSDGLRLFAFGGAGLFVLDPETGSARDIGEGTSHGNMDWLASE